MKTTTATSASSTSNQNKSSSKPTSVQNNSSSLLQTLEQHLTKAAIKPSNMSAPKNNSTAATSTNKKKLQSSNTSSAAASSTTAANSTSKLQSSTSAAASNKQSGSSNSNAAQTTSSTNASSSAAKTSKDNTNNSDSDLLEVTVIPVDEQPYSKHVQIPSLGGKKGLSAYGSAASSSAQGSGSQSGYGSSVRGGSTMAASSSILTNQQYPSLKDLFQNSDSLWRPIFGSFVGANKKPQFAIFRKPIERRQDIAGIKRDTELSLHILYLKRDITQFPRNAFANQIEVYCSKFFYGPLVVVFCDTKPPYKLHDFPPYYLIDEIEPLNELEQKCYPLPFGAKRCSLVRALMSEERFTHNLENLERVLTNHEFMLYCYKTSFCPISNSTIHDWSKCNYAHRQQDFRRPPYLFFYYPERCPHISEDGSWEACEYELHCDYAHTLVEILFNPLHYKLQDCSEKTSADKFKCVKHKERCCHAHSNEEKKLCNQVLEQLVPKVLPQKEDIMQYYLEMLPDYQTAPTSSQPASTSSAANSPSGIKGSGSNYEDQDGNDSESSPTASTAKQNESISDSNKKGADTADNNKTSSSTAAAGAKKTTTAKDASKAAANLQKASDLQRQKFMDVFQQMQASPAQTIQKTYKVKSESKPSANSTTTASNNQNTITGAVSQSALLRPGENPFSKVKNVVMNPIAAAVGGADNSPKGSDKDMTSDFHPFGDALSNSGSSPAKPTIFDKLDNKVMKNEMAQKMEKIEAAKVDKIKDATAKVDKRLRKKAGKLVKGVVTISQTASAQPAPTTSNAPTVDNETSAAAHQQTPEKKQTTTSSSALNSATKQSNTTTLQKAISTNSETTIIPSQAHHSQLPPSLIKAQSTQIATTSSATPAGTTLQLGEQHQSSKKYHHQINTSTTSDINKINNSSQKEQPSSQLLIPEASAADLKQSSGSRIAAWTTKLNSATSVPSSKPSASNHNKTTQSPPETSAAASSTSQPLSRQHNSTNKHQLQSQTSTLTPDWTSSAQSQQNSNQVLEQAKKSQQQTLAASTSKRKKLKTAATGQQNHNIKKASSQTLPATQAQSQQTKRYGALIEETAQEYAEDDEEEEFADQELPQSDKESTEADIKMVKLQLLKHQMDSLKMSQEDSDHFYLQQISEVRESHNADVVPLLSSRSNSPVAVDDSTDNQDGNSQAEEQIDDNHRMRQNNNTSQLRTTTQQTKSTTQQISTSQSNSNSGQYFGVEESKSPSRLKHNANQQAAIFGAAAVNGSSEEWPTLSNSQQQQSQSQSKQSHKQSPSKTAAGSSQQSSSVQLQSQQKKQLLPPVVQDPPELMIYRKLAREHYTVIEVADYFESVSMRLIALGMADLLYQHSSTALNHRHHNHNNVSHTSFSNSIPSNIVYNNHLTANNVSNSNNPASQLSFNANNRLLLQQEQATLTSATATAARVRQDALASPYQSTILPRIPEDDPPVAMQPPQHLLQVTHHNHNRLLGSAVRRGHQVGGVCWLNAFNWSLFVDPLTVWNACEQQLQQRVFGHVQSETLHRSYDRRSEQSSQPLRQQQQQWLIYNNAVQPTRPRLDAMQTVPPIIRHIWGLPLANSVGFGSDFNPRVNINSNSSSSNKQGAFPLSSHHNQYQTSAVISSNAFDGIGSAQAQAAPRPATQQTQTTQPQSQPQQQQPSTQIYKKGNNYNNKTTNSQRIKTSNSNNQVSQQSSNNVVATPTLNEQNKA